MRISPKALNIALLAASCIISGHSLAETRFYDPANSAPGNTGGKTTGYNLFKTIGCPGRQLLDPPCKEDKPVQKPAPVVAKPAPAPAPQPVAAKPAPTPQPATKTECLTNVKPGECYVTIIKDPVYRTEKVKKLVKEAGERIEITPPVYKAVKVHVTSEEIQEVIPAKYEKVKERVMVKPATTRVETVPAVFAEEEVRVLVKPASKKAIEVPAVYEDVTEKVLVHEAYTTWKKGTETNIQKIDPKTGEIYCLVEVPAQYTTVTRRVLKTPATVRYEDIPAEYTTVKRVVMKSPATTRTVEVPAEYAEREVTKLVEPARTITKTVPVDYYREVLTLVQPAGEKRVPVPAEYAEVEQQVLVSSGGPYCVRVLCDVNVTPEKVAQIQKALNASGFNAGTSGALDEQTMQAVAAFQKAKGIDHKGYITLDTLNALGVPIN